MVMRAHTGIDTRAFARTQCTCARATRVLTACHLFMRVLNRRDAHTRACPHVRVLLPFNIINHQKTKCQQSAT